MRNLLLLPTIGGGVTNFHQHHYHQSDAAGLPPPLPPPLSACAVTQLTEADYDLDTLKKLKLGLRSSLWSRPNANANKNPMANETNANSQMRHTVEATSNPTDYSIAV